MLRALNKSFHFCSLLCNKFAQKFAANLFQWHFSKADIMSLIKRQINVVGSLRGIWRVLFDSKIYIKGKLSYCVFNRENYSVGKRIVHIRLGNASSNLSCNFVAPLHDFGFVPNTPLQRPNVDFA